LVNSARISTWFTIGELAKRTGVATSALRFYEERGLISSVRNESGHRRFPRAVARRVSFIVFAQRVGLTLEEIGHELAMLPSHRIPREKDWDRLTTLWTARIEERIQELRRLQSGLTRCIGCGCLSLQECAVMNPHDQLAEHGPGPRYWYGDEPLGEDGASTE
jgi:MerR family redox-sensitive transcriptional activator SoxR